MRDRTKPGITHRGRNVVLTVGRIRVIHLGKLVILWLRIQIQKAEEVNDAVANDGGGMWGTKGTHIVSLSRPAMHCVRDERSRVVSGLCEGETGTGVLRMCWPDACRQVEQKEVLKDVSGGVTRPSRRWTQRRHTWSDWCRRAIRVRTVCGNDGGSDIICHSRGLYYDHFCSSFYASLVLVINSFPRDRMQWKLKVCYGKPANSWKRLMQFFTPLF